MTDDPSRRDQTRVTDVDRNPLPRTAHSEMRSVVAPHGDRHLDALVDHEAAAGRTEDRLAELTRDSSNEIVAMRMN